MEKKANELSWPDLSFHPVIKLPKDYEVYDFSGEYDPNRELKCDFGIGKFNEVRPTMYKGELYTPERNIHMGIDIGCPIGTKVHAFWPGSVVYKDYNGADFDYGNTLVTRHEIQGTEVFALHGHLAPIEIEVGTSFSSGDLIARVGDKSQNGGWNPHLHLQLSLEDPGKADMPGVVTQEDLESALRVYVDPRAILGMLY